MKITLRSNVNLLAVILAVICLAWPARAAITDLSTWTEVQDPPAAGFTSTLSPSSATLNAGNTPVASGTDIGYQTVNGQTPATSTSGYSFDPSSDLSVAIDFGFTATGATGVLGLGFGIGEDRDGMNSAGVAVVFLNGSPYGSFGGAARVNDANQSPLVLPLAATSQGSFFVSYDSATGDITVGASATQGAASPSATNTFTGLQNLWNDTDLLVSFFLRSEGWLGGTASATFTNFRVLEGSPAPIPEPSAAVAVTLLSCVVFGRRARRN
ncbi:MAG: hypothetical protein GC164_11030 [Phycisphaera sp.]|nr:hypothetical protein [Phycisphaera sp.]